jgi:glycosyltransferase involved in cell wall biosynthesis
VRTGIRWMDRAYRRAIHRTLGHRRVPLLGPCEFRPGAILFATGSLGPGGSERQIITTLLALARAGCSDLSLVCHFLDTPLATFYRHRLDESPVACAELGSREALLAQARCGERPSAGLVDQLGAVVRHLPPELGDVERFALEVIERRPAVLHAWLDDVNVKAGLAAAIVGVPRIVLGIRSVAPANFALFQPYMRAGYRELEAWASVRMVANSEAGARSYEQWLGLPSGRIRVLPNGLDLEELPKPTDLESRRRAYRAGHGIPDSCVVVGSVMRFSEEKRPMLWLETAAAVAARAPDTRFLVVGDGPLRGSVGDQAARAGLASRLVMPGHQERAIDAIAAMDVFLLTSRLEGLPNVLIEAQAIGVPVVTTNVGGAGETLSEGETGYAVGSDAPSALADAIMRIVTDADFRARVKQRGPAFAREKFDIRRVVKDTLAVYGD